MVRCICERKSENKQSLEYNIVKYRVATWVHNVWLSVWLNVTQLCWSLWWINWQSHIDEWLRWLIWFFLELNLDTLPVRNQWYEPNGKTYIHETISNISNYSIFKTFFTHSTSMNSSIKNITNPIFIVNEEGATFRIDIM